MTGLAGQEFLSGKQKYSTLSIAKADALPQGSPDIQS